MVSSANGQLLISLNSVTLRLRDRLILPNTTWKIKTKQHWAILGPNGAGKSTLVRALVGEVPVVRGSLRRHYRASGRDFIGYVSFEQLHRMMLREDFREEARIFSGQRDSWTTARQVICPEDTPTCRLPAESDQLAALLEIDTLLDRDIRCLSTGEIRKVLVAQALIRKPRLLILDEPFEGLDRSAQGRLARFIDRLMQEGLQVILVTHRFEEIVDQISHVLLVKNGRVYLQGRREQVLKPEHIDNLYGRGATEASAARVNQPHLPKSVKPERGDLITMKNITVTYKGLDVLKNLNWSVKAGQNWAILGPNGAGKTTLLNLITADHPQAYANEIYLFGRRRGSGETIWDIKSRIGMVSAEFQQRYQKRITSFKVVLSGFFDSVGLYRRSTPLQQRIAQEWIDILGLMDKSARQFDQLSYGEQRMVLIARSMVKSPVLLILDEPCQGLDRTNRRIILDLIDFIGKNTQTQLLYVTHHPQELPSCITHALRFAKTHEGAYAADAASLDPIIYLPA